MSEIPVSEKYFEGLWGILMSDDKDLSVAEATLLILLLCLFFSTFQCVAQGFNLSDLINICKASVLKVITFKKSEDLLCLNTMYLIYCYNWFVWFNLNVIFILFGQFVFVAFISTERSTIKMCSMNKSV